MLPVHTLPMTMLHTCTFMQEKKERVTEKCLYNDLSFPPNSKRNPIQSKSSVRNATAHSATKRNKSIEIHTY